MLRVCVCRVCTLIRQTSHRRPWHASKCSSPWLKRPPTLQLSSRRCSTARLAPPFAWRSRISSATNRHANEKWIDRPRAYLPWKGAPKLKRRKWRKAASRSTRSIPVMQPMNIQMFEISDLERRVRPAVNQQVALPLRDLLLLRSSIGRLIDSFIFYSRPTQISSINHHHASRTSDPRPFHL